MKHQEIMWNTLPKWVSSLPLLFWLILFSGKSFSQYQTPETYVAYKISEPVTIDGKATENAWEQSDWSDSFIEIEGQKIPPQNTRIKMCWNDSTLFVYAKLDESHIWGDITKRDEVVFYNNDFEIFLDPDGDTHNYFEFEMNVLNTVWDLFLTKPYRNSGMVIDAYDIPGLQTAVHINGTLNNPADKDEWWAVEIAIPFKALKEDTLQKVKPGNRFWRINFSRVNWDFEVADGTYQRKKDENGAHLPEHNWVWSPQYVVNMHEPEHWGYVYFSEQDPGSEVKFTIPADEHIKWYLYELYDKRRISKAEFQKVVEQPHTILGNLVRPSIEFHTFGWNIIVESPFSGKTLVLQEDGHFFKE